MNSINDCYVPPTITPLEVPEIKPIPLKWERIGWVCPKCGSSNNPDILSCPNCYSIYKVESILVHKNQNKNDDIFNEIKTPYSFSCFICKPNDQPEQPEPGNSL